MNGLEELQALTQQAEQSAQQAQRAVAGGAGSPIEVRMAQAFQDVSKSLSAMADVQAGILEQQKVIVEAIGATNSRISEQSEATRRLSGVVENASDEIWHSSRQAAEAYVGDYRASLDGLKKKADEVMGTLGQLDNEKSKAYEDAVDASVSKLYRSTAFSAALLFCLCLVGGALAAIGAWWSFTAWPWLVGFAAKYGIWIAGAAALVIFIVWCVVTRKK